MLTLLIAFACSTEPAPTKEEKATDHLTEPEAPAAQADADGWTHWGEDFDATEVVAAADLLADPASFEGREIRVEGRITEVCQSAGCWMVIAEGDQSMRVMMKDHAFAVDKGIAGQDCQVEGLVTVRELDPEFVKHLEEESEDAENMPEKKAATDGKVFEFEAAGVSSKKG
jgi:hypothetical protein